MTGSSTFLVIGGCRSGKSGHALRLAENMPSGVRKYFATCVPYDDEMKKRVKAHQTERDKSWITIEVPVDLPEAIYEHAEKSGVILVDCLTLWITNLLMENRTNESILCCMDNLAESLIKATCPVILVSNEVGAGIVPENSLARNFRDLAGFANQKIASVASHVIWMVAGIPVVVKG